MTRSLPRGAASISDERPGLDPAHPGKHAVRVGEIRPSTCTGCRQPLTQSRSGPSLRRWCSGACRVRHVRRPARSVKVSRPCSACGTVFAAYRPSAWVACSKRCRRLNQLARQRVGVERTASCAVCSAEFTTIQPRRRYCSPLCANRANWKRNGSHSRRRFPTTNPRQRLAVADRDDWVCGLCRRPIDATLRWPDPGSLSLDHIDPDGEHVPENWQAAHLACNVQAGDKRAAA